MQFKVKKTFKGAIRGCYVREFQAGEVVEIDDPQLVDVALAEGWIAVVAEVPLGGKSKGAAPRNKAVPGAPENKSAVE